MNYEVYKMNITINNFLADYYTTFPSHRTLYTWNMTNSSPATSPCTDLTTAMIPNMVLPEGSCSTTVSTQASTAVNTMFISRRMKVRRMREECRMRGGR